MHNSKIIVGTAFAVAAAAAIAASVGYEPSAQRPRPIAASSCAGGHVVRYAAAGSGILAGVFPKPAGCRSAVFVGVRPDLDFAQDAASGTTTLLPAAAVVEIVFYPTATPPGWACDDQRYTCARVNPLPRGHLLQQAVLAAAGD